ncbi:unnamed protein product [Pylaiella littoralis]
MFAATKAEPACTIAITNTAQRARQDLSHKIWFHRLGTTHARATKAEPACTIAITNTAQRAHQPRLTTS